MGDYAIITELLHLSNLRVVHYQLVGAERINLMVESVLSAALCPDCGRISAELHDVGGAVMIRDLPIWDRRCWLQYVPRRFKCATCRDTFVERVAWREPGLHTTVRYEQHIYQRARHEAVAQVARAEGLSEEAVQSIFARWAKKRSKPADIRW